jgi:hypothetical protein
MGKVFEYYRTVHNRNGVNGANGAAGKAVAAVVHFDSKYVNAYWDGTAMYFGDGDNVQSNSLGVLDVCGHELTHGVTEFSANLNYQDESGALNESFSDVMGASIEFYAQPDGKSIYPNDTQGAADWKLGEDCWLEGSCLRDMRNPASTVTMNSGYQQPTKVGGALWQNYKIDTSDNGGVHQNSGPQNFFYYLLSDGGSGTNDGLSYSVTGIGITNARLVAYRALTVYCTTTTDYKGARDAWVSAANDLNAAWVPSVKAAWNAVGVAGTSPVITSATSLRGAVGSSLSYQIVATQTPISFAATGLPTGVTVITSTGLISGTPTVAGTFNVSISATNSDGTGTASLQIVILPADTGVPVISSITPNNGVKGILVVLTGSNLAGTTSVTFNGSTAAFTVDSATQITATVPFSATNGPISVTNSFGTGSSATDFQVLVLPVVISQVYGGGGNSGALYKQDYIELYNRSASNQSLAGWSVQYASATGTSWTPTTLSGSIGPGKYYLVAMSTAGTTGSALPIPDATGSTAMAAPAGKVALVNSTTALSGANPVGASGLQDLVGYGTTANGYEGTGPAPAPSVATAVFRARGGTTDSDNNAADFTTGTPNPRNAGSVSAAPVITSTNAVSGFIGVSLTYQITASNGPTSFGASNLPTGLAVNTTNGLISGAPTTVATNVAKVFASNSSGTGTSNVTFIITTPQIPVITSSGTANGTVGTAFNYTITASNSPSSFGASNLPSGLSVNTQSGAITGTPTVAGTNTAIIYAGNSAGTASNNLVVGIAPASGGGTVTYLTENFDSCTNGNSTTTSGSSTAWSGNSNFPTVSAAYQAGGAVKLGTSSSIGSITSKSLNLSGNGGTYTIAFLVKGWTTNEGPVVIVANGVSNSVPYTALMSNTFEPKTLSLSGGTASTVITLQTASSKGRYFLDEVVISSTAPTAAPTTITSATNVPGQVGSVLSYTITANNSPSSFGVSTNLPTGLSLNSSSGLISGTPSVAGTNVVTVTASNSFGGTSNNVTFAIGPLLAPVITSATNTNGTMGQVFSYQITASNSPTSFNASNLPTGLNVNTNSGLISGIPQAAGTNTVALYARNAAGVGTNNLTLGIASASSVITLAAWDVNSQTNYGASPLSPTTLAANLTAVGLTRASGLTTSGTASAGGWGANGWYQGANGTVSNAVAANQFATFSIGATNGYKLSLSSITKLQYRRSSTGPTNGVLQVQVGSGAFADITNLSYSSTSSSGAPLGPIDLSTNAQLQNISNGVPVNFRLVNLGSTNVGGNWYVYKTSTTNEASLVISGTLVTTSNVTPMISTSGTLGSVSTTYGTASPTPASFRVSGENLAQGILVSAPAGYEVSATGVAATDYASSVTVGSSGTLAATTVYVRLASTTVPGTYAGNVQCTSLAATPVNVATASSTVDKKSISISGITAAPKTYDGTRDAVLVGSPGLVGLEAQDATNVGLGSSLVNFVTSDAGPDIEVVATYSLTGSSAVYYNLSQPVGLMAEILQKPATIRANDRTKTAGKVLNLGTGQTEFSVLGLISVERIASVTLTANGGTTADAAVATYLITPSDPVAPFSIILNPFRSANYKFTFIDGTLTVTDAPTTVTLSDWANQNGLSGADAAPDADPDHDGVSNLMAYYMDLNPKGGQGMVGYGLKPVTGSSLSLTYRRAKGVTGVSAVVQASGDLASSSWSAPSVEESVVDKGSYEEVTATVTTPTGSTKMFMRLSVQSQ